MAKTNTLTRERRRALELIRGLGESEGRALDPLIHERVRLGILSALAASPEASGLRFTELKQLLGASDGNLSVHGRKLEEAGYVACHKFFDARVPATVYRLTARGRRALERYLDHLEALIQAARPR